MDNYKTSEAARLIGVSVRTLQRWDVDGVLVANRTPTNRQFYTHVQIDEYFEKTKGDNKMRTKQELIEQGFKFVTQNSTGVEICAKFTEYQDNIQYVTVTNGVEVCMNVISYANLMMLEKISIGLRKDLLKKDIKPTGYWRDVPFELI